MGVEIRIGYNSHQVVADFLGADPEGLTGIVVDAKHLERHQVVIEAARDAGKDVYVETLTDRLAVEGYDPGDLVYADSFPFGPDQLKSLAARGEFVERVAEPQIALNGDVLVAPHYFSDDVEALELNAELARLTVHEYGADYRVRAVCAVRRTLLADPNVARKTAQMYGQAGVAAVELRLSPLGGPNEGVQKIKSTFDILRAFGEYEVPVTLGFQGPIGEVAYALGLVEGYSTGVGDRDRYDYKGAIASQRREAAARDRGEDRRPRASARRVLLPNVGLQIPMESAKVLYADPGIRARIACRLESCAVSVDGPTRKPRQHFLHSRADAIREIDRLPSGWRATHQRDQIQKAIEVCEAINGHHLSGDMKPLQIRTLESLRTSLDQLWSRRRTA